MVGTGRQADSIKGRQRAFAVNAPIAVNHGYLHVLNRGGSRQQIERLKYETDPGVAYTRELQVAVAGYVLALEAIMAAAGLVQAPQDIEQRRLAGAGRPAH